MTRSWDAVVIGGGPAGASAAIRLAEARCSCLLLESKAFPRNRPGETLHPGVEPLLRQIGLWEKAVTLSPIRSEGVWVSTKAGEQFQRYGEDSTGPWRAVNIPRSSLDSLMLEHVRQSGVTVIRDHVRGLKVTGGRVHGVLTSKSKINAHFVIDGTGGGHLVARLLGMPIEQRSHQLFAKYGYVKGIVPLSKNAPHLSFNSTGWTWIAPVDRDLTQWTRLDLVRSVSKSQSKTLSSRPKELDSLPAIGRTLGADVTWRIVNKPAGHGYFIAGDAAAVVDPAASDGFIRSVLSGRLAGHLASQVLCSGMAEEFAAEQYAFWIQGQFARCVTKLDQVYSTAFPGWKTSSASQGMDT